uniref:BPTI/Kunitz inhibitor domain-containing protein n=1 Tax=Amphimedon queenslandica TaxID=400682 RepID=A0A1X7SXG8_AMPQE
MPNSEEFMNCPIDGQFYDKEEASCPKTCSNRYLLCSGDKKPGCSCPEGQLIDEMKNQCVHPDDCPKVDPCTLNPQPGPCTASITSYYYNYTTETCQEFRYSGCFPNENNFPTQHECEEKCSNCYPVCTPEYCTFHRKEICSLPSSLPGSVKECPGGCALSHCSACYYSYNELPIPNTFRGCPKNCSITAGAVNKSCMDIWGACIQIAYNTEYADVASREKIKDNFRCWEHPCTP